MLCTLAVQRERVQRCGANKHGSQIKPAGGEGGGHAGPGPVQQL